MNSDAAVPTTDAPDAPQKPKRTRIVRSAALNRMLALYDQPRYLEVGVCRAVTFRRIRAAHKVAVDPLFQFDVEALGAEQPHAQFHEIPSDQYFAEVVGAEEKFDVIYLDGLHTFEQTLRDLMNALDHLQPNGAILIDDTFPPHYVASLADRDNYFKVRKFANLDHDQRWMGDVYRLVWFIDTFCPHLSYGTIKNNHGQTLVWRNRRTEQTERTVDQVANLTFEEMVLQADTLRLERFGLILDRMRADLGL